MSIAVVSDIHGNIVALEAVLSDLKQQGGADLIVAPGDFYVFGPAPKEIFQAFQVLDNNVIYLLGNTDRYLIEKRYPSDKTKEAWQDTLLQSFHWAAEQLGPEEMEFIENMPPFQPVDAGNQHLLFVHGSPRSDEEGLGEKTTPKIIREMPIANHISILIGGHTHIPIDRMIGALRVVNVGSVGIPFDGDPRASYAIISNLKASDRRQVEIDIRRIPYNIEKVVGQFYRRNHPAADIGAYNIREARPIGDDLIYTSEMRQRHKLS